MRSDNDFKVYFFQNDKLQWLSTVLYSSMGRLPLMEFYPMV